MENWSKSGDSTEPKKQFDAKLVKEIYETELLVKERQRKTVPLQRNYLWPNFGPETATFEHVMAIMLMINEKLGFAFMIIKKKKKKKDIFKAFLERILRLKEGRELSMAEKTNYLVFMINAFQSLKDKIESETILRLANGALIAVNNLGQVDDACVSYCERFMEFLIDHLSQLPTRRYLRPLVADVAVVAKCHLRFELNDHVGTQLTDDEVLQSHYNHLQSFQLLAFKKVPKLRGLALANIGAIDKRNDLTKKFSVLSPTELKDLVCCKLKLVSTDDLWSKRVDFLFEVMVSSFEKQQSQKEAINALPLYPNKLIMWDESVVPSINYTGEGCLALPKLNLQFLTLHDYLLRNFNLFRLESTYEIHEDIQQVVPHLLAYINNEGETAFRGWSRMAVPIKQFKIAEVKQPSIREVKPSAFAAEVTFSISSYKAQIRSEWNSLKEHDVLFLLSIRPSFEPKFGLQFVRVCEIIDMRDKEGTLMNDFTGRIKRDEWKPPKGALRIVTIALDTAQYHMDDVYGMFNILMRRKPKENNFKAILESIRDLMNDYCYGNPPAAQWTNMPDLLETVDFKDTFLDIEAITSCIQSGLAMVVSPPGTGKTDIVVQILNFLYHNCPTQRTLIITHSNQALPDLFEKILQPTTDLDFSWQGRVNAMLRLARSLQLPKDVGYTCETAGWQFLAPCAETENKPSFVKDWFPFKMLFSNIPHPVFTGESFEKDMRAAKGCFQYRAFELLKSTADRANYLMTKQAKIVAMTCPHAALKRKDFLQLGFKYDNLLMEESAQILEIGTFIPMLLQRQEDGYAQLKRCILIGDHHQLPPVIEYGFLEVVTWIRRYRDLGDLAYVKEAAILHRANAGFSYDYQLVDVPDYCRRGESAPSPWFYQNEGEAEYIVSVYIYMCLLGYPANKISILTTYNGQKLLILARLIEKKKDATKSLYQTTRRYTQFPSKSFISSCYHTLTIYSLKHPITRAFFTPPLLQIYPISQENDKSLFKKETKTLYPKKNVKHFWRCRKMNTIKEDLKKEMQKKLTSVKVEDKKFVELST
ncbi:hypothetical protein UlMin_028857 [Ulmus minor]